MPATRKTRAAVNKVTKPASKKTTTRRAAEKLAAAVEVAQEPEVLAERPNNKRGKSSSKGRGKSSIKSKPVEAEEDEDREEDDEGDMTVAPSVAEDLVPKPTRGRQKRAVQVEIPDSQDPGPGPAPTKRGRKAAMKADLLSAPVSPDTEIPETQQEARALYELMHEMDDFDTKHGGIEELPLHDDHSLLMASLPGGLSSLGSARQHLSASSGTAEPGDPVLRLRLGEMTRKYEAMEQKYRDLREVAVKDAERNFDRLRKQSEEKAKLSKELIDTLKAELTTQKALARESQRLKQHLESNESTLDQLRGQVTELTMSLSDARTQIKALTTKLSASRAAEMAAHSKIPPGSALRGSGTGLRGVGHSEAIQQVTRDARMKEDLYGDLTGLIVRAIKHEASEDVFDCLQTAKNGTLHFKLAINSAAGSESYDDVQMIYTPQLDPGRDRALIDVLPDYLVEEIEFSRPQAAKFYERLMRALSERQD